MTDLTQNDGLRMNGQDARKLINLLEQAHSESVDGNHEGSRESILNSLRLMAASAMTDQTRPAEAGKGETDHGSVVPTSTVVEILPTKVWIEDDLMGSRHVVMHHEGFGNPFTYASFHYDYAYTSNAGTWAAARRLALSLGATEPVEQRQREWHMPTADELREQIKGLQAALESIEGT